MGAGISVGWYLGPGPLTELDPKQVALLEQFPADAATLCRLAQGLLITPDLALGAGVPLERHTERNVRPAAAILDLAIGFDNGPLDAPRALDRRVVGTCRHFAVLSCAFLIARGISARARCGFATYFVPGRSVDHWITEHWSVDDDRWVRIDSEIAGLDLGLVARPDDLEPREFLTGGEAWQRFRAGDCDPMTFGVHGTDHAWGWAEIAGNLLRDVASLQKLEMLPWDEWGPMKACYDGELRPDVERHLDACAAATVIEDAEAIAALYDSVPVPANLLAG